MKKFLGIFALLLLCCSCTLNKKGESAWHATSLYTYTIHTLGGVQDTIEYVGSIDDSFKYGSGYYKIVTPLATYCYVDKIEIIDIKTVK